MIQPAIRRVPLVLLLLIQPLWISSAFAQVEQATLIGTVRDEGGGVVPGARVVATQTQTQASRETVTTADGHYTIPYLPVGTYEVTAELSGFSRARVTEVPLRVGMTATVDLTLKPGAVAAEITVIASAAQLQLHESTLGQVISGRQMIELPLVGRNPYSLVTRSEEHTSELQSP